MLKRLLIFFIVHLLVITLVINTYSEASESPWGVRSMSNGQIILRLLFLNTNFLLFRLKDYLFIINEIYFESYFNFSITLKSFC